MPLSEEEKQRIREEELLRLKVREEHRLAQPETTPWKTAVFWLVMVAAAILLFAMLRANG